MINRVVLTGRLTKDVDLSFTPQGIAKAQFTLAVNRTFANQSGDREADFINIQAWRKQAENAANFLKKGSLVGIDGKIQSGSYERDGQRIYFTNVVADSIQFLEPRNSTGGSQGTSNHESSTNTGGQHQGSSQGQYGRNNNQSNYTRADEDPFANSKGPIEVNEDDLPF
ncbi:single-stranded DNA-binding protein [Lysinibacillus fusiformis]|uniref:single-stranded DNA-binding protein n=1 Tax=Lysinibacillus fusiformis TaxID=28031 RepID=UPI00263BE2F8|nr:single-stranded DNA-binding protein [Lysinibacillus fusiformis]MDC6268036.1 single-stranded DNA-binding protein [Lysinibacillus sphaericus]MDN4967474.1 single-stranded DNA-binding protein [Lysinibacillus fusiformis]